MGGMGGMAAALTVLVQAKGINEVSSQLRSVDSGLRNAGKNAGVATKGLEDTGKRGSGALGALGKVARSVGAVALGAGLIKGAKDSVTAFEESRKVGKQTEAVLKSTGGAANVTAKQVGDLANTISRKTGVDDEAIQSGSNLLLTFKNIRNEAGAGRDIFNQTTAAAVDLSAAGFGSIESASKQLGKALNDPIKGMSALGRSGITFSEDQKQAIAALMETGKASDRVRAQQIILREVQSQVGGSAAAQGSAMDKLRVSFGNIQESIGGFVIPILDKAAAFFAKLFNQMQDGTGAGGAIVAVFGSIFAVGKTLVTMIAGLVGWFVKHQDVSLALGSALGVVAAAFLVLKVQAAIQALIVGVTGAFWALNAAMAANPIGLVVIALAALVAALVYAYTKSETFRDIVTGVWDVLKAIIGGHIKFILAVVTTAWDIIKSVTVAVWNAIRSVLVGHWNAIKSVASSIFGVIAGVIGGVWGTISEAASSAWSAIRSAASSAWGAVRDAILTPIRAARDALGDVLHGIRGKLTETWEAVTSAASSAWNSVKKAITDGINEAYNAVKSIAGKFVDVGGDIVRGIASGIRNAAGAVVSAIKEAVTDRLPGVVKKALGISSPSKVFMALGREVPRGMALGIAGDAYRVSSAIRAMTPTPAISTAPGGSVGTPAATVGAGVTIMGDLVVQDRSDADTMASRLAWLMVHG